MVRVTQNGDLKAREKEKVHECTLGAFVSYAYFNPNLAPNCRSYGSEYNYVITCWRRWEAPRGSFRLLNDTLLRRNSLVVLTMSVSFWLSGLIPRLCSDRGLLRTGSSVAQSSQRRNETV